MSWHATPLYTLYQALSETAPHECHGQQVVEYIGCIEASGYLGGLLNGQIDLVMKTMRLSKVRSYTWA